MFALPSGLSMGVFYHFWREFTSLLVEQPRLQPVCSQKRHIAAQFGIRQNKRNNILLLCDRERNICQVLNEAEEEKELAAQL